jgi:uncharacterized membrane protein YphA (DoxX/SURF4 family)/thiol-disulfide isomerase/thioredoxin
VEAVLLVARLLLAGVFGVAASAKLEDRRGSSQAMLDFGLPERAAPFLGIGVPLAELLVALALMWERTARWGAAAALALLTAFLLVIGLNLLRGRRPSCSCFGKLHSEPIGASVIARNLALAAIASQVAWYGATERLDIIRILVLTFPAVLASAALASMLRSYTRSQTPVETTRTALPGQITALPAGLPVGSQAPEFELGSADGPVTLANLRQAGFPVTLLFLDPACGDCRSLLPHIHRWQREHAHAITFAIVSRGSEERNRQKFGAPGLPPLLLQQRDEVAQLFGTWIMPSAVVLRPDGRIWSRVAIGSSAIQRVVQKVITRVGTSSPSVMHSTTALQPSSAGN